MPQPRSMKRVRWSAEPPDVLESAVQAGAAADRTRRGGARAPPALRTHRKAAPPPVKPLEEQHRELRAMRKRQQQDRLERERQLDPDSIADSVLAAVEAARENDRRMAELWRAAHS